MSASDLRDAFNAVSLPHDIRCVAARLSYCDAQGTPHGPRNHQRIEFDLVKAADNSTQTVATDLIPPGANVFLAVRALAQKVVG